MLLNQVSHLVEEHSDGIFYESDLLGLGITEGALKQVSYAALIWSNGSACMNDFCFFIRLFRT